MRAWDIRSGKLVSTFHTVPRPGEKGHEAWSGDSWKDISAETSGPSSRSTRSAGILYMPVGSATTITMERIVPAPTFSPTHWSRWMQEPES